MTRASRRPQEASAVEVHTTGDVKQVDVERARAMLTAVAVHSHRPVPFAHVELKRSGDPSRERPSEAKARLDLDGRLVRAHVAAPTMSEAVDFLKDRLERQVEGARRRLASSRLRHRDDAWHHGDATERRPPYFPRQREEREIVRRKTFAGAPITPEAAVEEAMLLDHSFFLFTNVDTGAESVVCRVEGDWSLVVPAEAPDSRTQVPLAPDVAADLDLGSARRLLDLGDEPFVFFVDPETKRGGVLYRRYDGHYGLIAAQQ